MDPEFIEISIKNGKLRGLVKKSYGNHTYYSFQGIPYAKPPIGDLRFKVAEPFGQWEDVLDATKEGSDAPQKNIFTQGTVVGNEDCLYLNVYTPQKPGADRVKKAVMVFIHGGAFQRGTGCAALYGPDYLIEEDIVLVTFNYRIGALGFLSLENDSVPGNMGLKDQMLALRWVQDNISSFGGDLNNVTIFGQSAGAASVHYQLLSPLSRGLFHKAIIQSGSSLCQWALQKKPREKALLLASLLGCTSQDDETVLKFLKSVPAAEFVNLQQEDSIATEKEKVQRGNLNFTPCVEVAGNNPFLPDCPQKMMERGDFSKVPVIMGITNKEGICFLALKEVSCERVNSDISVMVPLDLNIPAGSEEEKALGREILKFYTNKNTLSWEIEDIKGYVDFTTDIMFAWASEKTRQCFLKHMSCPVYSYVFTYTTPRSLFYSIVKMTNPNMAEDLFNYGACHSDDMIHLFKTNMPKLPFVPPTSDDKVIMRKLLKAWSTFAKTGNPNCKELGIIWQPDSIKNPTILEMGKTWTVTKSILPPKQEQFWNKIYDMYSYSS